MSDTIKEYKSNNFNFILNNNQNSSLLFIILTFIKWNSIKLNMIFDKNRIIAISLKQIFMSKYELLNLSFKAESLFICLSKILN